MSIDADRWAKFRELWFQSGGDLDDALNGATTPEELDAAIDGLPDPEDYDPTPWCKACGARRAANCDCGPRAEND